MKSIIFIIPFLFFACAKHSPTSQIRETIYQVSEDESQTTAQQKAELKIKSEFAKEFGTTIQSQYVKSTQLQNGKAKNFSNYNLEENFKTLVKIKILDYSWENNSYWLKAELSIPKAPNQSKKHEKNFLDTERLEKEYEILKREFQIRTIEKREFPETRLGRIEAKIYRNEQLLNQIPSQLRRAEKLKKFSQKIEKLLRDNIYKYEEICSESYLVKDCEILDSEEFQESKNVLIEIKSDIKKELDYLQFKTGKKRVYEAVLKYLYNMREMLELLERIEQKIQRNEKLLNEIPAQINRLKKRKGLFLKVVEIQRDMVLNFMQGRAMCRIEKAQNKRNGMPSDYQGCKNIIKDLDREELAEIQRDIRQTKYDFEQELVDLKYKTDQKQSYEIVLKSLYKMKERIKLLDKMMEAENSENQ
ncbi:hypothetical protein ThvES_00006130 [Thiovulum sp. ES]|nr:hypothetical protein ThvES_00006130 [Thiovulum sp. ES]